MSKGEVVQESQNRACISACSTQVRLSLEGRARKAAYAFLIVVTCAGVSELMDWRRMIGRLSLPGTKCVPPLGGVGQPLGGSCAQALSEKRRLEPPKIDPPARAAAPCRKRRRLKAPALSRSIQVPPI